LGATHYAGIRNRICQRLCRFVCELKLSRSLATELKGLGWQ
jgi:hypothetical protein